MGVPKFFRFMSERYPCLSEFVREYQVPDFDNLYLDMNGIIHNCSHPDDGNAHFRITEEKIIADIFHYIEVLFQMIKPQKLFFMAIDGVAPRAKMNQQRGRRFRTAKEAKKIDDDAMKRGEKLPEASKFDSNCITPGTEFMARLHEQLKYFVVKKISEDPLWQRCEIILSGHETPGEGEHKIMDYIRYKRSQPGYDPNTRHCLYGLDADLIMLGLCTHEPHFSLLREEVKFGKKANKSASVPEEIRFFLLHLSLMREYIELEFGALKQSLKTFTFDLEKIIDDWVLMGFLVGNDFIPNLPNLHIANGALPILYAAYIDTLPQLDGYINENGILNLQRFEVLMKKLGEIDLQNFEEVRDDLLYMEAKTGRKMKPFTRNDVKLRELEAWEEDGKECLEPELQQPLEEITSRDPGLKALIAATEEFLDYEDDSPSDSDDSEDEEFGNYKKNYYMTKMEYKKVTREVMKSQAEGYIRAIQWNLHYYYNGVCSWGWFYPHHYAPYISDIKNFQNLKLEYDIGKPFMPYEQLLAVLPSASKNLLPECYQNLMVDKKSPIIKFYPENFETDLNGKRQDWEAVVLVPFIDEEVLLEAMKGCNDQLTPSEAERNRHGPMLSYKYTTENLGVYKSPMYFPDVKNNRAKLQQISIEEIKVHTEKLVKGAYPGAIMDTYYPGFPTMKHLQYQGQLKKAKVKVFEQASRGDNMIIRVIPSERVLDATMPVELLGKTVFVGWPHLVEAKVVEVFSAKEKYAYVSDDCDPIVETCPPTFNQEVKTITDHYANRLGIEFGKVIVLVKVKTMIGQKYMVTSKGKVHFDKVFCNNTSNYPLQLIVEDIKVHNEMPELNPTLESIFPLGSMCFLLTHDAHYGFKATIIEYGEEGTQEGKLCLSIESQGELDLSKAKYLNDEYRYKYRTLYQAAGQLGMTNYIFSRITGSFYITGRNKEGGLKSVNIGLDLKFNKKNLETPGYTKKIEGVWYYTDEAIDTVYSYADTFPEVVEYIQNTSYKNDKEDTRAEDIFPVDSDEKVKEVQTWLKSQAFAQVEKVDCNSAALEKEVVLEIEKTMDLTIPDPKEVKMLCAPEHIYKADLCCGNLIPDPNVKVELFDRIVNVRENHVVPYGLKGVVIGINKIALDNSNEFMFDVLFDTEFQGGFQISHCSIGRGYRLPINAFINISHGRRLYGPKTQQSGDIKQILQKERNVERRHHNNNRPNNRNTNTVVSPSSAFAKFNNQYSNSPPSYNAVPPFMPNGEPIYDPKPILRNKETNNPILRSQSSHNQQQYIQQNYHQHQGHQRSNDQHQKNHFHNNVNSEQIFDFRNPFPKQYAPNSYQGFPANTFRQMAPVEQNTSHKNTRTRGNDSSRPSNSQKRCDFMPSFQKDTKSVEETADALKKLLKIDTNGPIKETNAAQIPVPNKYENEFSKEDKTVSMKIGRDNIRLPFTVQLLSYYQSKSLGLPRYQYITSESGIQSQIKLPNRQIVIGRHARSREEASDFVAEKALHILNSTSQDNSERQPTEGNPKKIPAPPEQWRSPQNEASVQPQDNAKKNTSSNRHSSDNAWKGLIPLQVVKKEKASCSTNSNPSVDNNNEKNKQNSRTVLSEKPGNSREKDETMVAKKETTKPRRQRKMRIAANFGAKP